MISVLFVLCFSTGILLNDVEKDRIEIVVVLLKCCRTPLVLQISPATAINNPDFRKRASKCNQELFFLQNSRKVRRSLFGSCRRVIFAMLH